SEAARRSMSCSPHSSSGRSGRYNSSVPRLLIVVTAVLALAAGSARAAGPQSYSDPVGDNQGIGPDVRGATASSDGAGNITLAVDLVSPLAGSDTLQLEIDADATMSGSPGGYDVNFT